MSLATRCTHCGTIFKVVQDQLKVSEGWVRCGRCHEVFNAMEGLFDMDREPPPARVPAARMPVAAPPAPAAQPSPPAPAPTPPAAPVQTAAPPAPRQTEILPPDPPHPGVTQFDLDMPPEAIPETSEADALESRYLVANEGVPVRRRRRRGPEFADAEFPQDLMAADEWAADDWGSGPGELDEASPSEVAPASAPESTAEMLTSPPAMATEDAPARAPAAPPAPAQERPAVPAPRQAANFQAENALPPPSQRKGKPGTRGRAPEKEAPEFIRQADRKAIWRRPAVRGLLSGLSLSLVLLLLAQATHHWRDTLAAHQPALKPWLIQWCELAQCEIKAPMQLDDLQVDNIQLVRTNSEGEDTYRLTAIIHNRADVALQWPQLDLTLTDANGQVLVRRLFSTTDAQLVLGPQSEATEVPTEIPASSQSTVQWQLRAPDLKLAGYTAELFYP